MRMISRIVASVVLVVGVLFWTVHQMGSYSVAEALQVSPNLEGSLMVELLGGSHEDGVLSTVVAFENLSDLEVDVLSHSLEFLVDGTWRSIQSSELGLTVYPEESVELDLAVEQSLPRVMEVFNWRGNRASPRIDDVFRVRVRLEIDGEIHEEVVEFTVDGRN